MNSIRRRFSKATSVLPGISSGAVDKNDIDEQMKMLYMEPAEIDKKCIESATSYLKSLPRKSQVTSKESDQTDGKVEEKDQMTTSYEKSPESVVEGLPKEYFTPDFDPLVPNLTEISEWDECDMVEKFMTKIEEADTDKDVIIGHLTTMIDANYNDLVECMRNVQSIDIDLCRAGIQIGHGRQRIRSACDIIHSGAIKVKALHSKRGKFSKMAETIRSLQALKGVHQSMVMSIKIGEVAKAAGLAKCILECLQSEAYAGFLALKSIGTSTEKCVVRIRQQCDKSLKRLCGRKFNASDYEDVLSAYVILDYLVETLGVDMYDVTDKVQDSTASFYFDSAGCIEGLSQRINRFQLDDIDVCLHNALTEYIDSTQISAPREGDRSDPVGAYLHNHMGAGDGGDMSDVPLNLLYRHLTADVIAPCVVRTCELLADVVHTHFLLAQWHRCPFDPQNRHTEFLHRKPLDVKVTVSDVVAMNVQTSRTSLSTNSTSASPNRAASKDRDSFGNGKRDHHHTEIIDLGKEFHDEESDCEETDDVLEGDAALNALAATYRQMSQVQSTLSEELSIAIATSFETHFPGVLNSSLASTELNIQEKQQHVEEAMTEKLSSCVPNSGVRLAVVLDRMHQSRGILWEEMLRALVSMLNMLTFTSEVKIEDFLSMAWALNNMVELGKEFCGSQSKSLISTLEEKSKEYFHNFHCESFQMIRDMVEAESWQSVPIDMEQSGGILGVIKTTLLRDAARAGKICFKTSAGSVQGDQEDSAVNSTENTPGTSTDHTEASQTESPSMLMKFGSEGNPFHFQTNTSNTVDNTVLNTPSKKARPTSANNATASGPVKDGEIERKELRAFWKLLQDPSDGPSRSKRAGDQAYIVVTQTALNGVAKYVAKYLHLMYLLPASSKGIFDNLTQLFDYYLCAVFNGFMPFDERQKFMADQTKSNAPPPNCSMEFQMLKEYLVDALDMLVDVNTTDSYDGVDVDPVPPVSINAAPSGSNLHNPLASHGSVSDMVDISAHNAGEPSPMGGSSGPLSTPAPLSMSTPQPSGFFPAEGTKMSLLLRPPAIPLNIESTCMALNERIVAAESCCFISMILLELKSKIVKLVPPEHASHAADFISQYQRVAGQLRALIYRASCPQLIKFNSILGQITECAWDSKKMRSDVHDWVGRLADNCRSVWDYMMLTEQFAESSPLLREQVWLEICQAAFDVCLEGYSKVRKCSVEGRSAMTTDNIALHDALNSIHLCRPPRGKHYVDNFLRSAMLSEEELMTWVRDNWESYAYRHIHGLLTQTLFSLLNSKRLKDATAVIDSLYDLPDGESTSTLGMLSQSADATFSRAFNSTFRRQSLMMS